MTPHAYLDAARGILTHLETTQMDAVEKAADMVVDALKSGGTVNCAEIGHGTQGDFLGRAGGLFAVQPFTYSVNSFADQHRA